MNTLHEALINYLQLRRSLGFKLKDSGLTLPHFVSFVEALLLSILGPRWLAHSRLHTPAERAVAGSTRLR